MADKGPQGVAAQVEEEDWPGGILLWHPLSHSSVLRQNQHQDQSMATSLASALEQVIIGHVSTIEEHPSKMIIS